MTISSHNPSLRTCLVSDEDCSCGSAAEKQTVLATCGGSSGRSSGSAYIHNTGTCLDERLDTWPVRTLYFVRELCGLWFKNALDSRDDLSSSLFCGSETGFSGTLSLR